MKNLHFKAMNGQMAVDEVQGIVECFVAAIGNKDSVGDIIVPGAFDSSFRKRKPRVVWGHDWNQPIGKVLEIYEVGHRDPRLPGKMKQAGVGGVFAKVQFNLNSERGREAFSNVLFFGEEQEWSIGYKTLDAVWDPNSQANVLRELELYEVSPVLHGANQLTGTISIKDAKGPSDDEITSLRDSKWDTFDIAWAKKLKDEHPDIWGKGGNIKGNDQWRILTQIAAKGRATTQAELNALKLREAWVARHKGDFRLPGVIAQIKWLAVGTRGEDYMKNVVREAIDRKGKKSYAADDLKGKAGRPDGVRVGGFVRWDSSGGTAYGKVLKVAKSGTAKAKPTGPSMTGTEDSPAVEVQVWKFRNGTWSGTDTVTVHRPDALRSVENLPKSKAAPGADKLQDLAEALGDRIPTGSNLVPDTFPQERVTGDVMRGYGPRRGNLEKLLRYWRPIMRKPGGFRRCRVILADHPELYPLENLCAWLHHETTGLWPNEGCHHPGMKNCRKKLKGVANGSLFSDSEFDNRLRRLGKKDAVSGIEDYAPAEQQFIRSMLDIVAEHGRLSDGDDSGIYVGYTPADENEVAGMGIKCANCAFYAGGTSCRIVEDEVEPGGKCRLAAIDYDSVKHDEYDEYDEYDEHEEYEEDEEMLLRFGEELRRFVRAEPEFMEYLADDDNWVHEGREHDEDDWHPHMPLVPMGAKPCGCGGGCGKSADHGTEQKAGRTLSGRNRTRLSDAVQLIKSVIDEGDIVVKQRPTDGIRLTTDDVHTLVADVMPVLSHHGIAVKVHDGAMVVPSDIDDAAVEALGTAMENLGYDAKNLLGRIGRGGRGGGGRGGRGGGLRPEPIDPNAEDGDEDGMVQDGTTAQRPALPGAGLPDADVPDDLTTELTKKHPLLAPDKAKRLENEFDEAKKILDDLDLRTASPNVSVMTEDGGRKFRFDDTLTGSVITDGDRRGVVAGVREDWEDGTSFLDVLWGDGEPQTIAAYEDFIGDYDVYDFNPEGWDNETHGEAFVEMESVIHEAEKAARESSNPAHTETVKRATPKQAHAAVERGRRFAERWNPKPAGGTPTADDHVSTTQLLSETDRWKKHVDGSWDELHGLAQSDGLEDAAPRLMREQIERGDDSAAGTFINPDEVTGNEIVRDHETGRTGILRSASEVEHGDTSNYGEVLWLWDREGNQLPLDEDTADTILSDKVRWGTPSRGRYTIERSDALEEFDANGFADIVDSMQARVIEVVRQAIASDNPDMVYKLKDRLPETVYLALLERFKRLSGRAKSALRVGHETHKSLLPVVRHHGIPYDIRQRGVVYDLSTASKAAREALTVATGSLLAEEVKRHYGTDTRDDYAEKGWALPDGSFPIRDVGDLNNAIKAFGRAKDKPAAKAHIKKRASALGATDLLPDGWA